MVKQNHLCVRRILTVTKMMTWRSFFRRHCFLNQDSRFIAFGLVYESLPIVLSFIVFSSSINTIHSKPYLYRSLLQTIIYPFNHEASLPKQHTSCNTQPSSSPPSWPWSAPVTVLHTSITVEVPWEQSQLVSSKKLPTMHTISHTIYDIILTFGKHQAATTMPKFTKPLLQLMQEALIQTPLYFTVLATIMVASDLSVHATYVSMEV